MQFDKREVIHVKEAISQPVLDQSDVRPADEEDDDYRTMVFTTDEDYLGFLKYVYSHFKGKGLGIELTDAPIAASLRIRPSLLSRIPNELVQAMRPVTEEDIDRVMDEMTGEDLADFDRFHFVEFSKSQIESE